VPDLADQNPSPMPPAAPRRIIFRCRSGVGRKRYTTF